MRQAQSPKQRRGYVYLRTGSVIRAPVCQSPSRNYQWHLMPCQRVVCVGICPVMIGDNHYKRIIPFLSIMQSIDKISRATVGIRKRACPNEGISCECRLRQDYI